MKKTVFLLLCATLFSTISLSATQAVVFDFGGVLTTESKREAVVQFLCETLELSPSEFEVANQKKKEAQKTGKTDVEFWLEYAKEKKISLSADWPEKLNFVMKDAIGVNPKMYELVHELKRKNVSVGLLSNIHERLGKLIKEFDLYTPFEPCLLSYEIGYEKPDLKAYQVLLDAMHFPPEEIVFIDDKLENVEAAKKLGIDAIVFESEEQIVQELKNRKLF